MGTFVAGLFDDSTSYWDVTGDATHKWVWPVAPNLWLLKIDGTSPDVSGLSRVLDMRCGLLSASGEAKVGDRQFGVTSERFLSWHDRRAGVERITVECDDGRPFTLFPGLDDSVPTSRRDFSWDPWVDRECTLEGRHLCRPMARTGQSPSLHKNVLLWQAKTRASGNGLSIAMTVVCEGVGVEPVNMDGLPGYTVTGESRLVICRFIGLDSVVTTRSHSESAAAACMQAMEQEFDACLAKHEAEMSAFWDRADVTIDGPAEDQRAVRFCILSIGGARPENELYSVGAKLLAGPWYWGQVFWDMDVFILPYLTRVFPETARLHIQFRHAGLPEARRKAATRGTRMTVHNTRFVKFNLDNMSVVTTVPYSSGWTYAYGIAAGDGLLYSTRYDYNSRRNIYRLNPTSRAVAQTFKD